LKTTSNWKAFFYKFYEYMIKKIIVENFEFNMAQLTFKVVRYFLTHPVFLRLIWVFLSMYQIFHIKIICSCFTREVQLSDIVR